MIDQKFLEAAEPTLRQLRDTVSNLQEPPEYLVIKAFEEVLACVKAERSRLIRDRERIREKAYGAATSIMLEDSFAPQRQHGNYFSLIRKEN